MKQAEIRERIAKWLHGASTNPWKEPSWGEIPSWRKDQYRKNAYFLMVQLKEWGIGIEVSRLTGSSKWEKDHCLRGDIKCTK